MKYSTDSKDTAIRIGINPTCISWKLLGQLQDFF